MSLHRALSRLCKTSWEPCCALAAHHTPAPRLLQPGRMEKGFPPTRAPAGKSHNALKESGFYTFSFCMSCASVLMGRDFTNRQRRKVSVDLSYPFTVLAVGNGSCISGIGHSITPAQLQARIALHNGWVHARILITMSLFSLSVTFHSHPHQNVDPLLRKTAQETCMARGLPGRSAQAWIGDMTEMTYFVSFPLKS